jgi:hypothetical protein
MDKTPNIEAFKFPAKLSLDFKGSLADSYRLGRWADIELILTGKAHNF